MPSKEDLHFDFKPNDVRQTTQDFVTQDVDDLVARIKENLRLRSGSTVCKKQRATPYRIPTCRNANSKCRSCDSNSPRYGTGNGTTTTTSKKAIRESSTSAAEPYEFLQILLKKGSLIKEAVKRLQTEHVDVNSRMFCEHCESPIVMDLNLQV